MKAERNCQKMFKTRFARQSINRVGGGFAIAAMAFGICSAPAVALARELSDAVSPSTVALGDGNLYIVAAGTAYEAFTSGQPSGCGAVSSDTLKGWQSLAQTALLSGKKLVFGYNDCGSKHLLETLDLLQ